MPVPSDDTAHRRMQVGLRIESNLEPGALPCFQAATGYSFIHHARDMSEHARHTVPNREGEAEERLHLALAAGRMGTWDLDLNQRDRITLSPEFVSIFEWANGEFDGRVRSFLDRIHP